MEASFLEIYNETIRDLLALPSSTTKAPPTQQQHDIKLDPALPGGVFVTNVTPTPVRSQKQVAGLLRQAAKNRAVAATNCNERSSRSHSVFRLQLSGDNEVTGRKCKGQSPIIPISLRLASQEYCTDAQNTQMHANTQMHVCIHLT